MSMKRQVAVSAAILLTAVAVVLLLVVRGGEAETAQGGMEGHNHAAMSAGADEQRPVSLDAEGARRIGVSYTTVERRQLPLFVESVGTVTYDETRLTTVNPKIEGWVEKLHVDFTGAPVRAGQPLMELYSPMLVSAQEELILAARLAREAGEGRAAENARQLLSSARRRLAYWDIPQEDIQRIEESGEPTKTLTLRAPASGIVVEKAVVEGDRIMPGMAVYRVADLSRVWIDAEVFEKDLALVREGQGALVSLEAYPGRVFTGRVSYVYPSVSMQSRTARVRLELANPDLDLRPGMYARVRFDVPQGEPTLVVPRSAVISTGERALVFVRSADGTLVPREVRTGRASGRMQEILAGLSEGDRVASSAAFLVDAESNLGSLAMPGMDMGSPEGDAMEGMDHSGHDTSSMQPDTAASGGHAGHSGHGG